MFKVVRENVLAVNEDRKSQQHRHINYKNVKEFLELRSIVVKKSSLNELKRDYRKVSDLEQ